MSSSTAVHDDVFTVREIARAAGADVRRTGSAAELEDEVRALIASGEVRVLQGRFVPGNEAVKAVRLIAARRALASAATGGTAIQARPLFAGPPAGERHVAVTFAASGLVHLCFVGVALFLATMGVRGATDRPRHVDPARLVFLALPGPGGGGGGGGSRQPAPAPRAKLEGHRALRSPVPVTRTVKTDRPEPPRPSPPLPAPQPAPRPVEPPPPVARAEVLPPVVAPVVSAPADERDRAGVLAESSSEASGRGPGAGTGAGSGSGSGIGEGEGSGIGEGSGGGTGGGPYGPGSGITPPALLREVKPQYSEEGRRRAIQGDVVMEIVVRADGTVGNIRLIHGLGADLDQRAAEAVRQWRFDPARRRGTPVDVLVEVAVEFRLR